MRTFLISMLSVLLISSCADEGEKDMNPSPSVNVTPKQEFKGDSLYIVRETTTAFSFILPSGYSVSSSYPLIIFLDPHGKGSHPLQLYREAAGKYGYMAVGSDEIRNGMPAETCRDVLRTLIAACKERFAVDESRIYLAGFSGGARVASANALEPSVSGVIYCSAGFTVDPSTNRYKLFAGLSGLNDMNYLETVSARNNLIVSGYKNCFIEFKGGHEWPPAESMEKAFLFLAAHEENRNKRDAHAQYFQASRHILDSLAVAEIKGEDTLAVYEQIIFLCDLLGDDAGEKGKNLKTKLGSSALVKKKLSESEKFLQWEMEQQGQIREMMGRKQKDGWKELTGKYRVLEKSGKSASERQAAARLLGFISLGCYSLCADALNRAALDDLEVFTEVYRLADPGNPEQFYLRAVLAARRGRCGPSRGLLMDAVKNGFSDSLRLAKDPSFTTCRTEDEGFSKIFREMARSLQKR